jgi:hypothetical protein
MRQVKIINDIGISNEKFEIKIDKLLKKGWNIKGDLTVYENDLYILLVRKSSNKRS